MYFLLTENCPFLHSCVLVWIRKPRPAKISLVFAHLAVDNRHWSCSHGFTSSSCHFHHAFSGHLATLQTRDKQVQPPAPAQTTCQLLGPGGPPVISSLTMFLILYCRNHFTCVGQSSWMSVLDKQPRCHWAVTCQVQIQWYNAMQWWWVTNQFEDVSNT